MGVERKYHTMMRLMAKTALLFFLFVVTKPLGAKNVNTDSLAVENLLNRIETNPPADSIEKILNRAFVLAKNSGNDYLTAQVYKVKGDFYLDMQLYKKSLENYYKALPFYKNHKGKRNVYLEILMNVGLNYYYLNNADSLFSLTKKLFNDVIKGVKNKDYYLQAIYDNMGSYYELKEDWASALQYYILSYKKAKKTKNRRLEAAELLNIGIIYDYSGDNKKAESYYNKALEIGKKYDFKDIVSASIYNINNNNDTTVRSLEVALNNLEEDKKSGSLYDLAMSYNNVGVIYNNLDSIPQALKYYHTSLGICEKYGFDQIKLLAYYNLGELYSDTSGFFNFDSAKYYLEKGIKLSEKLKRQDDKSDFLELLQETYAISGNYDMAFKTALNRENVLDIIRRKEKEKQLIEVKTRYETERKLKELSKAESDARRFRLYSAILILSMLLVMLIFFYFFKIRKIRNIELLEQQLFFNTLIENTEDYFLILSFNDLKITYSNPNFTDEFGKKNKISNINHLFELLTNETDIVKFANILQNIKNETLFSARFSVWIKTGNSKKKYVTGVINNIKNKNSLNGIIINFWDITKQHETEQTLKKSEKKYRDIYESFPDIYFRESREGIILEVSPSVKKLLGYTPKELTGKKAIDFYKSIEERKRLTKTILTKGEIKDEIVTLINKSGNYVVCSLSANPIFDQTGNYIGTEGVLKDITQRIQQQKELKETVDTKNKLFEIIANDLVNPVNQYKELLDILVENIEVWSKKQIISHVSKMKPIIDNTNCLLDNLLSWSRLLRNKIVPSVYSYNIYKIVKQSIEFFSYNANEKNITLKNKGDKTLNVLTDCYMLDIVIRNLISNAIKFSNEDDTVTISYQRENKSVLMEIYNENTTVPHNIIETLNKENLDLVLVSGSKYERGTGLGLVVVKKFLEILGSGIKISNNENGGVSFSFKLPLK